VLQIWPLVYTANVRQALNNYLRLNTAKNIVTISRSVVPVDQFGVGQLGPSRPFGQLTQSIKLAVGQLGGGESPPQG